MKTFEIKYRIGLTPLTHYIELDSKLSKTDIRIKAAKELARIHGVQHDHILIIKIE